MAFRRPTGWWKIALLAMVLSGCGTPGPDGPADTYGLDFSLPPDSETRGAIIFVVDGVNAKIFNDMLAAGELPAIRKYFVDRGIYAPDAVANTPSVTLANLTSIACGKFPGHHGITGINWFDRNRLIWRDYNTIAQKNLLDDDHTTPLIYEYFPDCTTFSIFFQPHRGATKFVENWTSAGPPFFFGWYEFVDRLTLYRFHIVTDVARQRREFPAVTVAYLLAPDFYSYKYGADSPQYRGALKHTDYQIGRVLGDLQRAGLLDKIVIAFVSDHGHTNVEHHLDMDKFLANDVGLKMTRVRAWENDDPFERRMEEYQGITAVPYGSGDRYWAICLRKPIRDVQGNVERFAAWPVRPSPEDLRNYPCLSSDKKCKDLLSILVAKPGVDAIAYAAGENVVRVRTNAGEVEFAQPDGPGEAITYTVISGDDPLGYKAKVSSGKTLPQREWLIVTAETNYPDLPAQILAYFRAKRAGDIAVFAASGWDFNTVNRAGHGGIRPVDLHVPLLIAGPGVPHETLSVARTVDLMPTLLELLGEKIPAGLDGKSLVKKP